MKASSTGHRPRTVRFSRALRACACESGMGALSCTVACIKGQVCTFAFMMQRRPALAGNNACLDHRALSPQPLRRPRGSCSIFPLPLPLFSFGNRLVKVITLITHLRNEYTPSHLFRTDSSSFPPLIPSPLSPVPLFRRRVSWPSGFEFVESSCCRTYIASGAK